METLTQQSHSILTGNPIISMLSSEQSSLGAGKHREESLKQAREKEGEFLQRKQELHWELRGE